MSFREQLEARIQSKDRWIVVLAKGHSGTRAIAKTLINSGVFMGRDHNGAWDKRPFRPIYDLARLAGSYVDRVGDQEWGFSRLYDEDIPEAAFRLLLEYTEDLAKHPSRVVGWKLPETVLATPWIMRIFLDRLTAIHWVRDPRDATLGEHGTDGLYRWGVDMGKASESRIMWHRWASWKYQQDIVEDAIERWPDHPGRMLRVKAEDFNGRRRAEVKQRLSNALGLEAVLHSPAAHTVGQWRTKQPRDGTQFPGSVRRRQQGGGLVDPPAWLDEYLTRYGYPLS